MRRLFMVALLVCGAALAWTYREELGRAWDAFRAGASPQVPSPALADSAQAKLAMLSGPDPERVALSEAEVQSLVQFRVAGHLPGYVVEPEVTLEKDRLRVAAQVPTDRFPRIDELAEVVGFLPDTTEVMVSGQLIPLRGHRVGFAVDEVSAARVPLPRGLIPTLLRRFGRGDEPGLPPDAVPLPLPAGAAGAYVRNDSLIIVPRTEAGE